MVADGQHDRVLESLSKGCEAPAVSEPVGHHRHDHAGDDADEAERGPQADDRERRLALRKRIDDARKQHLLADRHDPERHARQHDAERLAPLDR